jgi:hypothetical protein
MARRYGTPCNLVATSASYKTAGNIISTTAIRPKVYDFSIGTEATPADNYSVWQAARSTQAGAGTSTAVTPQPLDPGDPASTATAGNNYTAEPTVVSGTPIFGPVPMNQRATYRWVAAPNGELVIPAAANGLVFQVKSAAYTGQNDIALNHEE